MNVPRARLFQALLGRLMNTRFVSDNTYYEVECSGMLEQQVKAYVNRVEGFVPTLEEVFGLETLPPFGDLKVVFGDKGPCYEKGGIIRLPATMHPGEPQNIYGGLFYETIHGLLEGYMSLQDGRQHYLPKGGAVILQVATLDKIEEEEAKHCAKRLACGWGCSEKQRPILRELARIYRENGFGPIRAIYAEMREAICPILYKETLVCDLNRILRNYGVTNLIEI
jgi:hypothetical protein